jgi:hypothetical protein
MKIRIRSTRPKKQNKSRLRGKNFARRKQTNGRRATKPSDTRLRTLLIPTPGGLREAAIRGSKETSRLGKYWAAIQKYLQTGDDSALLRLKGKTFTDASGNLLFPTDRKQLDRQASAGVQAHKLSEAE